MQTGILSFIRNFFLRNILKRKLIIPVLLLIAIGCNKEETDIGLSIYHGNDLNVRTYSLGINKTKAFYRDSTTTDERSKILLGSYVDPYFGKVKAGFAVQFLLSSFHVDFGNNPQTDSVKLLLKCVGYYGPDTTVQQTFRIYKLTEPLNRDTAYYSNTDMSELADLSNPLAEYTIAFNPNSGYLEIPLPQEFGNELLTDTALYEDNEVFTQGFPGLYVEAGDVTAGGAVYYFSPLVEDGVMMTVYFSNDSLDSLSYSYYVTQKSAYFTLFAHDYSGTDVENFINDTAAGTYCYVQSGGGVMTQIDIDGIKTFIDSMPVGINKAELVVDVDTEKINGLQPPDRLLLEIKDNDETFNAPVDYFMNDYYFNGYYDETEGKYKFVITQYVQELLKGSNQPTELIVFPQSNKTSVNRVILKNDFKLLIYYTKF